MPTWVLVLIIVAVIVVVAAAILMRMSGGRRARRTGELRERFGPEYDRLVGGGSRKQAEQVLADRERRHAELDIKPLPEADRAGYALSWQDVQLSFLDQPAAAVREAEALIVKVMSQRGYPSADNPAAQVEELSVEHARQLDNLRAAQTISAASGDNKATTEDLRQAMVRYRSLFADLLRVATDDSATPPSAYPDEPVERVRVIPGPSEH
ncbi:MAG: hypothetical protein QOF39_1979 [Frankiales bacterium]|nr:hypothetical protein [Frankiales bacterium]